MFNSKRYLKLYHLIDDIQFINEDFVQKDYSFCDYSIVITKYEDSNGVHISIYVHYQRDVVLHSVIKLRSKWVNPDPIVRLILNVCY